MQKARKTVAASDQLIGDGSVNHRDGRRWRNSQSVENNKAGTYFILVHSQSGAGSYNREFEVV